MNRYIIYILTCAPLPLLHLLMPSLVSFSSPYSVPLPSPLVFLSFLPHTHSILLLFLSSSPSFFLSHSILLSFLSPPFSPLSLHTILLLFLSPPSPPLPSHPIVFPILFPPFLLFPPIPSFFSSSHYILLPILSHSSPPLPYLSLSPSQTTKQRHTHYITTTSTCFYTHKTLTIMPHS